VTAPSHSPRKPFLYLLVSIVALIPCFWLPRIEAGDLASHTYNAWLTSLVQKDQAPGLWLAPQTNNVLFDILLLKLGTLFGFLVGEKVAVCFAVLLFFWGAFAFVSVVSEKPAWFLVPLLLTLTYGWSFHMGFFNFYLSLGLAFIALAIFWRAQGLQCLYALVLVPLIWLAHPLGVLWFASVAAFVFLARSRPSSLQWLFGAAFAFILGFRFYLQRTYPTQWRKARYADLLGAGQLVLGTRYDFLAWILLLAVAGCVLLYILRRRREQESPSATPGSLGLTLRLYLIVVCALLFLPDGIKLPSYNEPLSFISSRFTLATAILACCLLSSLPVAPLSVPEGGSWVSSSLSPRKLFAALSTAIALIFFAFAYQDAAKTYQLEQQAQFVVNRLPQGSRVLTTIYPFSNFQIFVHHVVDRACINRCFNIDNYEPSSAQFRLRANPGNRIVAANDADANRMMLGTYIVQPTDLPLFQIFQCAQDPLIDSSFADNDLCFRPLRPGPLP
jgi:hypothetical protein